jgi:hypothetical protein
MTPKRLKRVTVAILAAGVIASGTHLAPNGSGTATASSGAKVSAQKNMYRKGSAARQAGASQAGHYAYRASSQ